MAYIKLRPFGSFDRLDDYDMEEFELDFEEESERCEGMFSEPEELWGIVDGLSSYEISSLGRVWSHKSNRFLRPYIGKNGYPYLNLMDDYGHYVREYIHRLVAKVFVYNDDYKTNWLVRHLDDDRQHCHSHNLRWGTIRDNYYDSLRNGRRVPISHEESMRRAAKSRKAIIATNIRTGEQLYFESGIAAAEYFGVDRAHVSTVLHGRLSQLHGYRLEFARRG